MDTPKCCTRGFSTCNAIQVLSALQQLLMALRKELEASPQPTRLAPLFCPFTPILQLLMNSALFCFRTFSHAVPSAWTTLSATKPPSFSWFPLTP